MKIILKETDQIDYDFEEEVYMDSKAENIVIAGNEDFRSFGDSEYIDIIRGDYYDDEVGYDYETLEELEKISEKHWNETCIRGCCQRDWQKLYYTDEVSEEEIDYLEAMYFGDVTAYVDEDNCYYLIPNYIVYKGKQAICDFLGYDDKETVIKKISGKHTHVEYDYEDLD